MCVSSRHVYLKSKGRKWDKKRKNRKLNLLTEQKNQNKQEIQESKFIFFDSLHIKSQ